MIRAEEFCGTLLSRGFRVFSGVPCSQLSGPIRLLTRSGHYIPAAAEGAAVAIAAGAVAAGAKAAVLLQNSGLGNLINPLTSLNLIYEIPVLAFVSMRGWPRDGHDEPQHAVMGGSTHQLLDVLGVRHWTLWAPGADLDEILDEAEHEISSGRSAFILVERGTLGPADQDGPMSAEESGLTRASCLTAMVPLLDGVPVVATTGYTSRDLFSLSRADTNFYMQGSMGHASAFGLGSAIVLGGSQSVVVLDGDGSALMHLGTLSTIGAASPLGLVHVIFVNGSYESTGGQPATSRTTNFAQVALGCGYSSAVTCTNESGVVEALVAALARPGPHCLIAVVSRSSAPPPPRASSELDTKEIYQRFAVRLARIRHSHAEVGRRES